jgi:RHS repeat-associated protein
LLEFLAHLPRLEVLTGFDGELVAEYKVNGAFDGQNAPAPTSPVKEYIYREGQVLVVSEQGNAEGRRLQWLVHNQLGTPRMVFDTSGRLHDDPATTNVVEGVRRHDYLPFGEENVYNAAGGSRTAANGYVADGVRQQFTGHERDAETGLDFMQARYYASGQGRFASADIPLTDQWESDPQSWNLYTYVRNNPCVNIDPRGRETCYYTQSGSKIGCETDKRIRIKDKSLIFTPKKGAAPIVYDLDQINASFTVRPGRPGANDLAFEMQQRAPAIKQSVALFAGGSIAIGTGVGGVMYLGGGAVGGGVTTLGLSGAAVKSTASTVTVTFTSHGAIHVLKERFSRIAVENAIRAQVQEIAASVSVTGEFWGRVVVEGATIVYRAYTLADGAIRIGTYYDPSKK